MTRVLKQPASILSIAELGTVADQLREAGRTIVQCHGVFDLLHFGHLHYFKQARTYGDALFVTLTADKFVNKGPGRPLFPENIRAEMCAALWPVDYVGIVNDISALPAISVIRPDVYVKGAEYRNPDHDKHGLVAAARQLVESQGGRMEFVEEMMSYHSVSEDRMYEIAREGKLRTRLKDSSDAKRV